MKNIMLYTFNLKQCDKTSSRLMGLTFTTMKVGLFASFTFLVLLTYTVRTSEEKYDGILDDYSDLSDKPISSLINDKSSKYTVFYHNVRKSRESGEKLNKRENNTVATIKPKLVLVKKPIPKFNDKDSEEDYQMKLRNPVKYSDSVEHEDEDFNLDDYDFDTHHDEFAGRGKPLQPRMRIKSRTKRAEPKDMKVELLDLKTRQSHSKETIAQKQISKFSRIVEGTVKELPYDDEVFVTVKGIEKNKQTTVIASDEIAGDIKSGSEDSKGYEIQNSVRPPRSLNFSSYIDRLQENTNILMMKLLGYLPLFPQEPPPTKT